MSDTHRPLTAKERRAHIHDHLSMAINALTELVDTSRQLVVNFRKGRLTGKHVADFEKDHRHAVCVLQQYGEEEGLDDE